ncbi:MAG: response regulator transcription factor [Jatrophihabitantaceae bacterium]
MNRALNIVLGDDHAVFVDALAMLLVTLGHQVPATATNRSALIDAVSLYRPDVCVLESRLPDGTEVDVVSDLREVGPTTRLVVLTSDRDPATMHRALELGAVGYVHKTRGIAVLLDVLERVVAGEVVVEGSFLGDEAFRRSGTFDARRLASYLTQRELETLELLVRGLDTRGIARLLNVSTTTVRTHVQAVLTKLGVHSRLEAAALAVRFGLINLEGTSYDRMISINSAV